MKKIEKFHYMKASVVTYDNGDIDFYSYCTKVLTFKKDKQELIINLNYSVTTSRQVTIFIRERLTHFFPFYYWAKKIAKKYNDNCIILTKEYARFFACRKDL